jgi:exopolysaccharide production protein ExoQ
VSAARGFAIADTVSTRVATPVALKPPVILTWATFFFGVTAILLGSFVGSVGAYFFLLLWVLLALAYGRACLGLLLESPRLPWLLPCFAVFTTIWSQSHASTLKFGSEYVATAACAVLAASLLRPRALLSALTATLLVTAVLSVLLGRQSVDPMTGSVAFVGVFESKNQLGFFVSLMLLASVAMAADPHQGLLARLMGCAAVVLSLPLLVLTHSGTAVVSAVLAAIVLVLNFLLSRLSRFGRARVIFAAFVVLIPVALILVFARDDVSAVFLNAMGKDATLTGRTLLWQRAAQLIPNHPLFGYGFGAFWRHDDVNAESLWHDFHVLSRQGFHFHSTYVEATIETGYVGATILVGTLIGVFVGLVRWSWSTRSVPASFFVAVMFCLLTRSFVEVDVLQQFQIGSFVLFTAATYAGRRPSEDFT